MRPWPLARCEMPRIISWFSPASCSNLPGSPETRNVMMTDTRSSFVDRWTDYLRPSDTLGSSVLRLVRAAASRDPRCPPEAQCCCAHRDDPDEARDGERELRTALSAEPAGQDPRDRARSVEGVEVEADDPAAQVVGSGELHDRVRVRRPGGEARPDEEEQDAGQERGGDGREQGLA